MPEVINIIIGLAIALVAVPYRALRVSGPETGHDSFQPLPATRPIAIPVTSPIAVVLDDDRWSA